ncbi:MAG: hypothetical protein HOO67_06315 [Candidatus Peribacteraceae bacterium]|nr:hypothetical protein [Candidatus Peribacteraceae bacterium]
MSATQTSREAYRGIREKLGRRQLMVLEVIERHPAGITNLEICRELGWPINCVTGRVFELRTAGLVGKHGRRECRISRNNATTWARVQDKQLDLFGFPPAQTRAA